MGFSPGEGDLRSRNLARNRSEVAAVALDLFAAHGFDAVTVDEIVEAAGISRRTFFRYFESKEAAALAFEDDRLVVLSEALADRPPDEPLMTTIRRATLVVAAELGGEGRYDALRRLCIVQDNPSVHAWSLEIQSRWEETICSMVAEHLGTDPSTSVEARVVAGAAVAAFRSAAEVWLASGGDADLAALLAEAYDVLAAGLTLPDR